MKRLFLLFLFVPAFLLAQDKPEPQPEDFDTVMTLTDFWETVLSDDTAELKMRNLFVTVDGEEEFRRVYDSLKKQKTINRKISLFGIRFQSYFDTFFNNNQRVEFTFKSISFLKTVGMSFDNCGGISLEKCKFYGGLSLDIDLWGRNPSDETFYTAISVDECDFLGGDVSFQLAGHDLTRISIIESNFHQNLTLFGTHRLTLRENDFTSASEVCIRGDQIDKVVIDQCDFNSLKIQVGKIQSQFAFRNVNAIKVALTDVLLPEDITNIEVKWKYLSKTLTYSNWDTIYGFSDEQSCQLEDIYDELKALSQTFLDSYRARGDVESANACYRDIKAFENKRWKHLYKQDPSFEKWFRWRLNELISAYSDYGTNPAKAVIKSFWVIFFFTIFYMFFPSEWDISSKAAIIANFKRVADKKDKTASPVLKAIAFLVVSFLNAFTLSINSFVTLGFGHIPTKGVARYFTILQGFIGWFLLTIFSVSLISQVLN